MIGRPAPFALTGVLLSVVALVDTAHVTQYSDGCSNFVVSGSTKQQQIKRRVPSAIRFRLRILEPPS
ncbi:hypothetical protein QQP08_020243 [Theobroma cacao]|nr:hypothetical protein QQP08_020243 [Theobroma cacao]